jgi:hypothetical protein
MRTVTPDEMFEILRSVPLSQITLEENYAAEMRKMWDFLVRKETHSAIRDFDGAAQWMGWYGGHLRGTFTARWNDVSRNINAHANLIDASALLPTNLTMLRVHYFNHDAPRLWAARFHTLSFIKSEGGKADLLSTGLQWGALAAQPVLIDTDEKHRRYWKNQENFGHYWETTRGRKVILKIGSSLRNEVICM